MSLLGRIVTTLLDALAPVGCSACDSAGPTGGAFCATCGTPEPPTAGELFDDVPLLVVGPYRPPLSTAIVRLKYEGRPELSRPLAQLLAPRLQQLTLPESTLLVPVPMHARRLASRGYNQATLLAQELGRGVGLRCQPRLLRRSREAERQVGKSRSARLENASGAFELRRPSTGSVVLVDDVITTGSTVRACAQALAAGHVRLAAVVALARADRG